jgi:hypothetical protein
MAAIRVALEMPAPKFVVDSVMLRTKAFTKSNVPGDPPKAASSIELDVSTMSSRSAAVDSHTVHGVQTASDVGVATASTNPVGGRSQEVTVRQTRSVVMVGGAAAYSEALLQVVTFAHVRSESTVQGEDSN